MDRSGDRTFVAAAMLGWTGVGAYGIWQMAGQEAGDGWQRPYVLFTISLFAALGGTAAAAWAASSQGERPVLRRVGAGFGTLGAVSSLVAWAVPLWATLLAVTCAVLAVAAPSRCRPGLVTLAAAPVVGMAVMLVAIAAEVGREDRYGDYPAAFGLGETTIAAGSLLGLMMLARQGRTTGPEPEVAPDRRAAATM